MVLIVLSAKSVHHWHAGTVYSGADRAGAMVAGEAPTCTLENLTQTLHRLQRAAIRDAFGLQETE